MFTSDIHTKVSRQLEAFREMATAGIVISDDLAEHIRAYCEGELAEDRMVRVIMDAVREDNQDRMFMAVRLMKVLHEVEFLEREQAAMKSATSVRGEPVKDQFRTESPRRMFADFRVHGDFATGKGFRPSVANLDVYLNGLYEKEGWVPWNMVTDRFGTNPTISFRRVSVDK